MPRVLLLHTGGTLGMRGTPLEPDAYAAELTDSVPEIAQLAEVDTRIVCNLDSSDVGPPEWAMLAEAIAEGRASYDGFVVVHGTDTMAYTASALAFALQDLDRPVVLTGAQRPLVALRTDARRNLTDAVEIATREIPEVGICFDGMFLRGCRTTKSNVHDYRAFESPGCEPLAKLGVHVQVSPGVRRPSGPFRCDARFDGGVLVLHVVPGMTAEILDRALNLHDDLRGIVLATFGVGTMPSRPEPLAAVVGRAVDAGKDVLVVSQSGVGAVELGLYRNSRPLQDAGAIPGGRMRLEAAVTKLMHGLAAYDDREARRAYLERDVAGERD